MIKQETLGIYAAVSFRSETTRIKWSKIGYTRACADGSVDLVVECWPTNAQRIKIGASAPKS